MRYQSYPEFHAYIKSMGSEVDQVQLCSGLFRLVSVWLGWYVAASGSPPVVTPLEAWKFRSSN